MGDVGSSVIKQRRGCLRYYVLKFLSLDMQLILYPFRNVKQCLLLRHFLLADDRPGATSCKVALGTANDWLCAVSGIYHVGNRLWALLATRVYFLSYDTMIGK
jgi:hypothetical protein